MTDYGVPEDLTDALPWTWAEQRLVANRNYWVITASAAGRPHAMPVWGVWLPAAPDAGRASDSFWFSCSPNAHKLTNLRANPFAAIATDSTIECVSVQGRAASIDPNERAADLDAMVSAYLAKYWPDSTEHAEMEEFLRSHAVVEFVPDRAVAVIEREEEFSQRATRWVW